MTTPTVPENLTAYEYGVDDPAGRFTPADLAAIATYEKGTAGIPDSFDGFDADVLAETARADGIAETTALIQSYFAMASNWWEQLDSLYSDLSNRGPACRMGAAGVRYITAETNRFFHVLNVTRAEACRYAFGTAGPRPAVDAGFATFSDLPGIQLDGTAVAESQ